MLPIVSHNVFPDNLDQDQNVQNMHSKIDVYVLILMYMCLKGCEFSDKKMNGL